jgi:hypothetical protein
VRIGHCITAPKYAATGALGELNREKPLADIPALLSLRILPDGVVLRLSQALWFTEGISSIPCLNAAGCLHMIFQVVERLSTGTAGTPDLAFLVLETNMPICGLNPLRTPKTHKESAVGSCWAKMLIEPFSVSNE